MHSLAEAVEIARALYRIHGKKQRDGRGLDFARPQIVKTRTGYHWGIGIGRHGIGGFALDRVGAFFVADDLQRIAESYLQMGIIRPIAFDAAAGDRR